MSELTFAMADLAGFTAMTEVHGDDHAADFAIELVSATRRVLGGGDRLVKTIGDAVLLASPTPHAAVGLVGRLLAELDELPRFLPLSIGLHTGRATERDGDFFGSAVNLTARIADRANPGQVLSTAAAAAAARELGHPTFARGSHSFKNVTQPADLYEIRIEPAADHRLIDPICHMRVRPSSAVAFRIRDGIPYWFCSLSCANQFTHRQEAE